MTTTKETLVSKNGNSYKITEGNKVKKVTSLSEMKNLDVYLKEDYDKMNINLYRYFREQDSDTSWKKTYTLYRMYKISYSQVGLKIYDGKNYNRALDIANTTLDSFASPVEVYLYLSRLGINKETLKNKKMQTKDEKPVSTTLKDINKMLKSEEVTPRMVIRIIAPLYKTLNEDKSIEESVIKHYSKLLLQKFPEIRPIVIPIVEIVEEPKIDLTDLRKKFVAKITRCKDAKAVIEKVKEDLIPHRGFKTMAGKLVRAYEAKELKMPKFKNAVIDLVKNDLTFAEKIKPAAKFIERPPIIIEELISVIGNEITFKRKHTEYKVSKLEMYATDLLSAEPKAHVAVHKLLSGLITPEEFMVTPVMVDKTICLDYLLLKNHKLSEEQINEVTIALEDVLLQWEMQNPLHFVYKNMADYKIGTKMKVYYRDLFTYKVGIIHKYEGGYKIRYDDGEINFLLQHQEVKIIK